MKQKETPPTPTKEQYGYRESTSVYNPHFTIENKRGETVANIYMDAFENVESAEIATKKFIQFLNQKQG